MDTKISVKSVLRQLHRNEFVRGCRMPMEYTYGYPILQIKNDRLCLVVPYLKYKTTGEPDKTYVYPIRYVITVVLPEVLPIEYKNLEYELRFGKIDYKTPIGLFRHEAIKHLNKKEYESAREELYDCYDKVIAAILFDQEYNVEEEERMSTLLQMMVEPCQLPIYKVLDEDFYNKYLA